MSFQRGKRSMFTGLGQSLRRAGGGGGSGGLLASVAASGWDGVYNPASLGPIAALELSAGFGNLTSQNWSGSPTLRSVVVQRNGFDDTGTPTTFPETVYMTQRLRLPSSFVPNVNGSPNLDQGPFTFDGNRVVLNEHICQGESISGTTNNSMAISPKPIGQWTSYDRTTVKNSITVGAVFAHWAAREGRQVRCVEYYATDGTLTVSSGKITTPTLSTYAGDAHQYPHWEGTLDITTLAQGMIRVYAIAWPWVGGAASVLDSRDSNYATQYFAFADQYYRKRDADVLMAGIRSAAGGTPQVVSTLADAENPANAYASIQLAIIALQGANGGNLDGCELIICEPNAWDQSSTQRVTNISGLVVRRSPNVARAAAVLSFGNCTIRVGAPASLTAPLVTACLIFKDLDMVRTGQFSGAGGSLTQIIFDNCIYDQTVGVDGTTAMTGVAFPYVGWFGCVANNIRGNNSFKVSTTGTVKHRGTKINVTGSLQMHGGCTIGVDISNMTCITGGSTFFTYNGTFAADGQMHWYSKFNRFNGLVVISTNAQNLNIGIGIVSCLFEAIGPGTNACQAWTLSDDGAGNSTYNTIIHNNTCIGFNHTGSQNSYYDDTDNTSTKTFSASIAANTPIAGQCTITLTAALVGGALVPGDVIGCRQAPTAMVSDLTVVSGSGTIIGSQYICTPSTPTRAGAPLSVPTQPDARKRTHTWMSLKGNILGRGASKGDIFNSWIGGPGANGMTIPQASARQGNWEWDNGVGQADNNILWLSNFMKAYYGINSRIAPRVGSFVDTNNGSTETIVANVPQNYVNWQGSIGPPTFNAEVAGAGGGDYHLLSGHPSINQCQDRLYTSHDLDGLPRVANTNNSSGCYR